MTEVLPPDKAGVFTDHCVVLFEYNSFVNAPSHPCKFVYDYANGDFEGLCEALSAINLSSTVGHNNIDDDWRCWKDLFLAAVKDFVLSKKLKGRNPVPWIDSNILNLIKKKNSVRQKLKSHPNAGLRNRYKSAGANQETILRESRDHFYDSIVTGFRFNPKRLWSVLKLNSKCHPIPEHVSMATVLDSSADQSQSSPRVNADTSAGIVDLFNGYFASVFTIDSAVEKTACIQSDTVISDLTLNESTVLAALKALEVGKATGSDEIPAKLLKETASVIAPSSCKIFNKSLQLGSLPGDWKLANVRKQKNVRAGGRLLAVFFVITRTFL